ncbi:MULTISPECIES: MBOAT family protein [unclassified Lentimicrobium]|uniref:MBOAT family O-acyltransferase n=1 Tax=unclassified Lentimicrobium TaxID=2677434 RepID=UPI001556C5A4|nr:MULTISPECIES: MBOAT family O-acyltransferase [unclassified Lentimicrobium]NPD44135.1 MBOAT family protein [Lentimicrobium sp. S6]NPD83271.1 MBOAT family protein [Lentimicrobium sp. L6]
MVFSSSLFLLYFLPVFLLLYHLFKNNNYKNWVILFASIFFYAWGAPVFVFVVIGSVILDYYIINNMYHSPNSIHRKYLLALSISINVGLLLYFKYANFFVENLDFVLHSMGFENLQWTQVALPIGISFYTFQTLTYSIDVFRGVHKPLKNPIQYLVYIMLFPQMIAGPIVRFNQIADQIENRQHLETLDNKLLGFFRFCIGLAKKVLIANVLGAQADQAFALADGELTSSAAWIGIIAYTFQIYFDFSGYSDMAIGLGRIMGFKFPENFNNPYTSQSITEFWRRWHITLGSWMRDYLYIPLGGSRVSSKKRLYFNLWLVFLISGLWHGAAWNFVIWGAFHGFFLILDKLFLLKFSKKVGKYPSIILTFFITIIGWVIFRSESFNQIKYFLRSLFKFDFSVPTKTSSEFWFILVIAVLFSFITLLKTGKKWENKVFFSEQYSTSRYFISIILAILSLAICLSAITSSDFNPFIYFRF